MPIEIDTKGIVTQGGREIGRLEIAGAGAVSDSLRKLGASYFAMSGPQATLAARGAAEVKQGTLEHSNVAVADQTVRLVSVMRQFEMLQRAMAVGAEMNKRSVEEVAKVA